MPPTSEPHQIRLRGPWQVAWLGDDSPENAVPSFDTVYLPESWVELFGDADGRALFRRRFNRPSNLDPHERVGILLTDIRGEAIVRCNSSEITPADDAPSLQRYDVTDVLQDFNVLDIEIVCRPSAIPEKDSGLWRPVLLEIRTVAPA